MKTSWDNYNPLPKEFPDPPVWWWKCEKCGTALPEGTPAVVEMAMGALPNAVYCRACWDGPIDISNGAKMRQAPDGGLFG